VCSRAAVAASRAFAAACALATNAAVQAARNNDLFVIGRLSQISRPMIASFKPSEPALHWRSVAAVLRRRCKSSFGHRSTPLFFFGEALIQVSAWLLVGSSLPKRMASQSSKVDGAHP